MATKKKTRSTATRRASNRTKTTTGEPAQTATSAEPVGPLRPGVREAWEEIKAGAKSGEAMALAIELTVFVYGAMARHAQLPFHTQNDPFGLARKPD